MRSEIYEFAYQSCQCDFEINNAKMMSFDMSYYQFLVNDALWYNILELQMTSHMSSYKMMLSDFFASLLGDQRPYF
jgi:hypothetical protein